MTETITTIVKNVLINFLLMDQSVNQLIISAPVKPIVC